MTYRATGDNVISLFSQQQLAPQAMRTLESYWLALADGRMMPDRAEVDPRGLDGTLDRTFVIEQIAPGHARFRVAGSRLSRLLGTELRGMPLSALFHRTARADLADALRALFEEPARVSLRLIGSGSVLTGRLQAECLLLPLRDDEGQVTRAIGCLDWSKDVSATQRFRITDQDRRTLIGYARHPETDDGADDGATRSDACPDATQGHPARGGPELTVVN